MPEVHIRKDVFEQLRGEGITTADQVNEILRSYISSRNMPNRFAGEEIHLNQYHEHGNAD